MSFPSYFVCKNIFFLKKRIIPVQPQCFCTRKCARCPIHREMIFFFQAHLKASGMCPIWDCMLVGGLEMPSDQSERLECGDELDHWSGDSGEGVKKGWSGTCSWWLGVLSKGEEQLCCEGGVRNWVVVIGWVRVVGSEVARTWFSGGRMACTASAPLFTCCCKSGWFSSFPRKLCPT